MKALSALAAVALGIGTAHAVPVVTNGDFTLNTLTTQTNTEINGGGFGNFVTGWTSGGANAYNIYFTPAGGLNANTRGQYSFTGKEFLNGNATVDPLGSGGAFIGLDGDSAFAGPLSQTITGFTVGQAYTVSFDFAAGQLASRTGPTSEQLQVSLAGLTTETHSTAVVNNPSAGFTGWFKANLNFTATSVNETLSFLSLGMPSGLPPIALLDNVSIAAVPEPASLALLGAGLASIGLMRRRRA